MAEYGALSVTPVESGGLEALVTFRPSISSATIQEALHTFRQLVPHARVTTAGFPDRWHIAWPRFGQASGDVALAIASLDTMLDASPGPTVELVWPVMTDILKAMRTLRPHTSQS